MNYIKIIKLTLTIRLGKYKVKQYSWDCEMDKRYCGKIFEKKARQ